MEQFVALIRERDWENAKWVDYFIVDSNNPEQKFRDTIKEYLLTKEGQEDIKMTSEDFNWGDAMMYIPDDVWKKHYIKPVHQGDSVVIGETIEIIVDQDEVLIPKEYYDSEEEDNHG